MMGIMIMVMTAVMNIIMVCKDIKVSLNMDNLDRESIHKLWLTNKYWRNSLKDELIRKGFAKLNEEKMSVCLCLITVICVLIL